jgi:DNA-binding CsgD family transcriptional regulator
MGVRSQLLWQISQLTGQSYPRGVPDLKQQHPEYARAFPQLGQIEQLQALLECLEQGIALPLPQQDAKRRAGAKRKSRLSDAEIVQLRQQEGMTYQSIAEMAGISRARVGQILAKVELEIDVIDNLP